MLPAGFRRILLWYRYFTPTPLFQCCNSMLTQGQPYVEKGMDEFEARRKDHQLRALQRKAHKFGMELTKAA